MTGVKHGRLFFGCGRRATILNLDCTQGVVVSGPNMLISFSSRRQRPDFEHYRLERQINGQEPTAKHLGQSRLAVYWTAAGMPAPEVVRDSGWRVLAA